MLCSSIIAKQRRLLELRADLMHTGSVLENTCGSGMGHSTLEHRARASSHCISEAAGSVESMVAFFFGNRLSECSLCRLV